MTVLAASQQSSLSVLSAAFASKPPIEKDFLLVGRLEMMGVGGATIPWMVSNV